MKDLERIETIVLLLNSRPGLTTVQLSEACGVELMTMIEDLTEIMLAPDRIFVINPELEEKIDEIYIDDEPQIEDEITSETKWFCTLRDSDYIPVELTAEECVRLNEILEILPDGQAKQSIMKKLKDSIGTQQNSVSRHIPKRNRNKIPKIAENMFPVLQSAIRERKKVFFKSVDDGRDYTLTPLRVMYDSNENEWTILAHDGIKIHKFDLSSIYSLTITTDRPEFDDIGRIRNWLAKEESMPFSIPVKLLIHNGSPHQDKASIELEHHLVSNKYEFITWLLPCGDGMEIIEPQEFRQDIITRLKETLSWYEVQTAN